MNKSKDYYKILGITDEEKKLPNEEFKKVLSKKYKKLAIKYHPDRNGGSKEAEEKFKEVAEAYDVLSDEKKRAEYDNPMSDNFNGFDPMGGGFNMDDIFGAFFGGRRSQPRVIQGQSLKIRISVTLEELFSGCTKTIKYKHGVLCKDCNGSGKTKDTIVEKCPVCGGSGIHTSQNGMWATHQPCQHCKGTGKIIKNPCGKCNGSGLEYIEDTVNITIQPGTTDGTVITFTGLGNAPENGQKGINGDLYIIVTEIPHKAFKRVNNDLITDINLPVIKAILGCEIEVKTINNKTLKVKIPQGINEGQTIRLKGYGMPSAAYGSNGNMIGVIHLIMPTTLNDEEKDMLSYLSKRANLS